MRVTSLLMLGALGVAISAWPQGSQLQPKCDSIRSYEHVSIPELRGSWVALESMSLSGGSDDRATSERSRLCVHSEILNTTTSDLTMLSELHRTGTDNIDIARNTFVKQKPGRWNVMSDIPSLSGSEMLVVAADPSSHLVLALCLPSDGSDGQKLLSSVTLLARRQERGSAGVLKKPQIQQIRRDVAKNLGISYNPLQYDISC